MISFLVFYLIYFSLPGQLLNLVRLLPHERVHCPRAHHGLSQHFYQVVVG